MESSSRPSAVDAAELPPRRRLGELLVGAKVLGERALAEALASQPGSGKRLGALLIDMGILDEHTVLAGLGAQFDMPVADLRRNPPDRAVVRLLPEEEARRLTAIPVRRSEDALEVALADPLDAPTLSRLEEVAEGRVRLLLAAPSEVHAAIDAVYAATLKPSVAAPAPGPEPRPPTPRPEERGSSPLAVAGTPTARLVAIIARAVREGASDVHIETHRDTAQVRLRIDGTLRQTLALPHHAAGVLLGAVRSLAGLPSGRGRPAQFGSVHTTVDRREVDVRVALLTTVAGERAVLRLVDRHRPPPSLSTLGMPDEVQERLVPLLRRPGGLVLVAGPQRSGRSSTLVAMLSEVDARPGGVVTLEQPVDIELPWASQIQIEEYEPVPRQSAGGSPFAEALGWAEWGDPDVVMVGLIPDLPTLDAALTSAASGRLVLGSVAAPGAAAAVHRLLDRGAEPFMVAGALLGVVGQRLVRRNCPRCRTVYSPPPDEMQAYLAAGGPPRSHFHRGKGCPACSGTAFSGRTGVFELMIPSDESRALVLAGASASRLEARARRDGMVPMREAALALAANGVTTATEALRATSSVERP